MNREQILAKSQQENTGKLDERSKEIQTKANSISQGAGMVLCIIMAALGVGLTGEPDFAWCCVAIHWGMFAVERIVCAVKEKTVGQWVLASLITLGAVAAIVLYVLCLVGII